MFPNLTYRKQLITGFVFLLLVLCIFPFFFHSIENRQGITLNDWLLNCFRPKDVSLPIFLVIWATLALLIVRSLKDPQMMIHYVWAFIFLCIARICTISLVRLDPPPGLIPLVDPVGNLFYGHSFITRDLFFSGHTATVFLMFLCLKRRGDKIFALITTVLTAFLLLIQHVHYSVDILGAVVFSTLIYWLTRLLFRGKDAPVNN